MADQTTKTKTVGRRLYEDNWRQGSLISLSGAAVVWNEIKTVNGEPSIGIASKIVKPSHILVVSSQDCDIVADEREEPFVEVIVCRKESLQFTDRIRNKTTRYFAVDPVTGLVAYAPSKLLLLKTSLIGLKPQPWPSSEENLDLFIRWLATRSDRPSVPDEDCRCIR